VTQTIINFLNQKNFPFFDNIFAFDLFLWMLLDYQDKKSTKIIFNNENTFRKMAVICFFRFRLFCVKTNTMLQTNEKKSWKIKHFWLTNISDWPTLPQVCNRKHNNFFSAKKIESKYVVNRDPPFCIGNCKTKTNPVLRRSETDQNFIS
jgi:hypothetical protein